jgi:hypothetical protein
VKVGISSPLFNSAVCGQVSFTRDGALQRKYTCYTVSLNQTLLAKAFYLRRIQALPLLLLAAREKGPGARLRNEWSPEKR